MKAASLKQIKDELKHLSSEELMLLTLRLSKFKKENKELLTYLLFEASNEEGFIESVKDDMNSQFETININNQYYVKKSARKILRETKKFIRYSQKKETEVELLLYFCTKLLEIKPSIKRNTTLTNLFQRQVEYIKKKIQTLHEDLQHDFMVEIEELDASATLSNR